MRLRSHKFFNGQFSSPHRFTQPLVFLPKKRIGCAQVRLIEVIVESVLGKMCPNYSNVSDTFYNPNSQIWRPLFILYVRAKIRPNCILKLNLPVFACLFPFDCSHRWALISDVLIIDCHCLRSVDALRP
jgi:hypothetical protein